MPPLTLKKSMTEKKSENLIFANHIDFSFGALTLVLKTNSMLKPFRLKH